MKLKNLKKGNRFKKYKDGMTYKKVNATDADVINKDGKRLFGATFSRDEEVISLSTLK